jgi:hypothetical protein
VGPSSDDVEFLAVALITTALFFRPNPQRCAALDLRRFSPAGCREITEAVIDLHQNLVRPWGFYRNDGGAGLDWIS